MSKPIIKPGCSVLLVVEDDEALLSILGEAVAKEGLRVSPARNGAEALAVCRDNADDSCLAVFDVMLPGMDGLATASELRKIKDNIRFIFMSGYGTEEITQMGMSIGTTPHAEFFQKPFVFEDMKNRIRALVREDPTAPGIQNPG